MDVVGSLASLIAVAGLTKEIASLVKNTIQGYREAPCELQSFSNQIDLIQLELDCLVRLQVDIQQKRLYFSQTDIETLGALFQSALDNLKSIHNECLQYLPKGKGFGTRLNWALFDRKSYENLLRRVQSTETALSAIVQMINLGISVATRIESASRSESIRSELEAVREELRGHPAIQVYDKSKRCHLPSKPEEYHLTSAFKLSESWRIALRGNLEIRTAQNAFQTWHDFYLRLPVPSYQGNKAFIMALTYRTWPTSWVSFSILGGEVGFKNVVSKDSDIIRACIRGDTLTVRDMFLNREARPTDISSDDRNLLYYATMGGSEELVRFLLSSGTLVRSKLLLASSFWRRPNMARQFIGRGACFDVFGRSGFTPAFYLFGSSRQKEQQVELIEIMASNGFSNFNAQDRKGWTAIHRAAAFGTTEDIRALSRMGAALDIRTNNLSWTPVFAAVCYNNLETLQAILEIEPPDKDATDLRGWTLLHVAVGAGSFDVIPELLRLGCNVMSLSTATSQSVPDVFVDKAITPDDIAKACGKEVYSRWSQLLLNEGLSPSEEPEDVEWDAGSINLNFGGCECCEEWTKVS